MAYLSADEKTNYKAQVTLEQQDAKNNIDAATTPEDVDTAKTSGIFNINAEAQEAAKTNLTNAKVAAVAAIDSQVEATNAAIDNMTYLSDAEKASYKAQVAEAQASAKNGIDIAVTVEAVDAAKEVCIATIQGIEKQAADANLSNEKDAASSAGTTAAASAKTGDVAGTGALALAGIGVAAAAAAGIALTTRRRSDN